MELFTYRITVKPEFRDDLHPDGYCTVSGCTKYAVDQQRILRVFRRGRDSIEEAVLTYEADVWAYIAQVKND